MAASYLNEAFQSITHNMHLKNIISETISNSFLKISTKIRSRFGTLKEKKGKPQNRSGFITPKKSTKRLEKFSPKKYQENFKEKADQNKYFAQKLIKEQRERENRLAKREEKLKEQSLRELEEKENAEKIERLKQYQEKQEQINNMLEKSKERKEKLSFLKEIGEREYRKAISTTPLYKKIQKDFFERVEMPELEKRKMELQKKRELHKPIDKNEIKEHAKHHYLLLSELSEKKKLNKSEYSFRKFKNYAKSKALEKILEEEKKNFLEKQDFFEKKQKLIEKKKQYSELVKEVFQPTLDIFKKQEMDLIKARLNNPVVLKFKNTPNTSDEEKLTSINRSFSVNPRKFKKNPMVPEKPQKKVPVVKDYIDEFREARKKLRNTSKSKIDWEKELEEDVPAEEKVLRIKKKAEIIDREARKNEIKIGVISPYNQKCLEISEHVNDLIVSSIRAKLAIIENN